MINVYPMHSESDGPHAYEDFLREEGCPTLLRRDNSKMKMLESLCIDVVIVRVLIEL